MRHSKFFVLFAVVLLLLLVTGCGKSSIPMTSSEKLPTPTISDGKLASIEFKLGTDMKTVTDKLGKASNQGKYNNKDFLKYGETVYFFGLDSHKLSAIGSADKNVEFFGAKVGMAIADLKKVLGEPEKEFQHHEDNEWNMVYAGGENQLLITAKTKSDPVKYMELRSTKIEPAAVPKPAQSLEFKSTFKVLGAHPETDKYGNIYLVGSIKNDSSSKYQYALVEFDVVGQHGGQLSPLKFQTMEIQPQGTINFRILCSNQAAQYFNLKSIKGLVAK